jgi:hypothetical protein
MDNSLLKRFLNEEMENIFQLAARSRNAAIGRKYTASHLMSRPAFTGL